MSREWPRPADLHDTLVTSRHQPPVMSLAHRSMIVDPPPFIENMYMDESKYRNEYWHYLRKMATIWIMLLQLKVQENWLILFLGRKIFTVDKVWCLWYNLFSIWWQWSGAVCWPVLRHAAQRTEASWGFICSYSDTKLTVANALHCIFRFFIRWNKNENANIIKCHEMLRQHWVQH